MNSFLVGRTEINPPVVLAPMEGITDRAFRRVIRRLGGCGLSVTEFVSSEGLTRDVESAWRMTEIDPKEHPVSIQIYGRDPVRMAQAARYCEGVGADIIDINLGCPAKTVVSGDAGSALMKDPILTGEIFDAVFESVTLPVTVKMRLGWDHSSRNAPEIAALAEEVGLKMVAVHGRTRSDMYKGSARWDLVKHVKEAVTKTPVLVNGDINSPDDAFRALEQSHADGVMVGRGVTKDPWLLKRIACAFNGEEFIEPGIYDKHAALYSYVTDVELRSYVDMKAIMRMRQVATYFTKGLYNANQFRRFLREATSFDHIRALVNTYFIDTHRYYKNKAEREKEIAEHAEKAADSAD